MPLPDGRTTQRLFTPVLFWSPERKQTRLIPSYSPPTTDRRSIASLSTDAPPPSDLIHYSVITPPAQDLSATRSFTRRYLSFPCKQKNPAPVSYLLRYGRPFLFLFASKTSPAARRQKTREARIPVFFHIQHLVTYRVVRAQFVLLFSQSPPIFSLP